MITSINQYTKENKKLLNSIREINFPNIYTDDLYLKCIPVIELSRKPLGLPGGCKALLFWDKIKNIF